MNEISGIGLMEEINSIVEKIRFYENVGKSPEEIDALLDEVKEVESGNYYIIEKSDVKGNLVRYKLSVKN